MFSYKNLVGAAGFAALTMFAAGSAQAVVVDLSTLVANFGAVDSTFKANEFGNDLNTDGSFKFGAVTYDNVSTNANGRVLTTATKTAAQNQQNVTGVNGFTNAFHFDASASGFVGLTLSLQEFFPTTSSNIGFLDFRVTLVDVSGLGGSSGGIYSISQTELDTASVISTQAFTDISTGNFLFNPIPVTGDQPFLKALAGATDVLALVSGSAFVSAGGSNPSYTVTVSNVPLPAPIMLLISALFGMGFLGRRRLKA